MDWFDRLLSFRRPRRAGVAQELALRFSASVWDRIQPRVLEMSSAEARGYIRAKATAVLHAKATSALPAGLQHAEREHLYAEATEAVVEKVIAEVARIQRASYSRRHAA